MFHTFETLLEVLETRTFDRPPALVANAHVTGLSVARALAARDVPVIALDRSGDGVAPASTAVSVAGRVRYPLEDPEGFRADLRAVLDRVDGPAVAFGCMDEWVHGFADARDLDGLRLPFAPAAARAVLDKDRLYARCDRLDVPYPTTRRLWPDDVDPQAVAAEVGYPLVIKPVRKRAFEAVAGTNVVEVADADELAATLATAREGDVRVMAQERVDSAVGADRSLASYRPPPTASVATAEATPDPLAVVGNARVRSPPGYGTSCLVETVTDATLRERALSVLADADYHGISEAEFVYDRDRETYVLLDVNTRPWKWIGLPVAAGLNLPYAAYADAVGIDRAPAPTPEAVPPARWVYLPDYLPEIADGTADALSRPEWEALVAGTFEAALPDGPAATTATEAVDGEDVADGAVAGDRRLTTGVYRPSDPGPTYDAIAEALGTDGRAYYCAC